MPVALVTHQEKKTSVDASVAGHRPERMDGRHLFGVLIWCIAADHEWCGGPVGGAHHGLLGIYRARWRIGGRAWHWGRGGEYAGGGGGAANGFGFGDDGCGCVVEVVDRRY